jgi:hypothetical protein
VIEKRRGERRQCRFEIDDRAKPVLVDFDCRRKVVSRERVSRICHALRRIRANDGERAMNIRPAQRYCARRGGRTPKMFNIIKLIK